MLPTQARTSHTGPQGCFVHCWNVCVERCLRLHPIRTMHTGPIHEVPTYTHQPNSHFPHGWCTIYVPTIHPFHRHFVNFPTPRRCHACSESGHIAAFGCSRPPCHPHPRAPPLQHRPHRPFFSEAGTLIAAPWPTCPLSPATEPSARPCGWLLRPPAAPPPPPPTFSPSCISFRLPSQLDRLPGFGCPNLALPAILGVFFIPNQP